MNQVALPIENKINTVNVSGDFFFNESAPIVNGTPDESATIKLTNTQKAWLNDIAVARGTGMSTLGRDAIQLYIDFFKNYHKLYRYKKQIEALLEALP